MYHHINFLPASSYHPLLPTSNHQYAVSASEISCHSHYIQNQSTQITYSVPYLLALYRHSLSVCLLHECNQLQTSTQCRVAIGMVQDMVDITHILRGSLVQASLPDLMNYSHRFQRTTVGTYPSLSLCNLDCTALCEDQKECYHW